MKNTESIIAIVKRETAVVVICLAAVSALLLGSCAPRTAPAGDSEPDVLDQDVAFVWSADSDCATCHENAAASFADAACQASCMPELSSQCMTCHTDESGLAESHAKVTLDSEKKRPTLKKTKIESSVCESCHDKSALAEKTSGSTVLTDANGTVVNPHDIPVNEDHDNAGIECSSCHKLHASDSPSEVAPAVCTNCHHHKVFECGTCHT